MANNEKLNKEQQATVTQFLVTHRLARTRQIIDATCCYRTVIIDWNNYTAEFSVDYRTTLDITPSGHIRKEESVETKRERCEHTGQKSLDLPDEFIAPPVPATKINRRLYSRKYIEVKPEIKPKQKEKPKQLSLPLFGFAAKLHDISLSQGNEVMSKEKLFEATVEHYSLEQRKVFKLPAVIVGLLEQVNASYDEWESVVGIYDVAGIGAAMDYINGIEALRQLKGHKENITVPIPAHVVQVKQQQAVSE